METIDLKNHIDDRMDKLESKLDSHLQRITKVETEVNWLRGSIKFGLTAIITIAGSIISWFITR